MVGRIEQLHAASDAGEDERRAALHVGEQDAQVLVGRRGIAHLELHGGADGHLGADGDGAALPVGAEHRADQHVVAVGLAAPLVEHDPELQRPGHGDAVLRCHLVRDGEDPVERRRPGDLVDQVALGLRHDQRWPDGAAALRDRGHHVEAPGEQEADGPGVEHGLVGHEPVAARPGRRRGHAAHHGQPGGPGHEVVEHRLDGEAERVREQHEGGRAIDLQGLDAHRPAVGLLGGPEPHGSRPRRARRSGARPQREQGDGRVALDLLAVGQDGRRRGAHQRPGAKRGTDRGGDVLHRPGEGGGHEHQGGIRRLAELVEHLADDLTDRVGRQRVLREGCGEGHAQPSAGGRSVNGTVVT
ncbi:MAG: hypothetical protein U0P45_15725 [Acidimicrobiales bacterium]